MADTSMRPIKKLSATPTTTTTIIALLLLLLALSSPGGLCVPLASQKHWSEGSKPEAASPLLQLHKLSATGNNVTCNDGSQVGLYLRLASSHSDRWLIYLQGGGLCSSDEGCQQRWRNDPHLMSSKFWPKTRKASGILSNDPKENPHLWDANHVFVPYCSSDSWTGLWPAAAHRHSRSDLGRPFAFMGSRILERVLASLYDDLPSALSLHQAGSVLLAGDSAGATGVILNLDKAHQYIKQRARASCATNPDEPASSPCKEPSVRGLADSGWFLDNQPYDFAHLATSNTTNCDKARCSSVQAMRQASRYWNGQVPLACAEEYSAEPWRCYFGYRAYPTLKTPLFVVQWLFDEVQLLANHIMQPETESQWAYINQMTNLLRSSLEKVTAHFVPACYSHSLLTRSNWNKISIRGSRLPDALNSWTQQVLSDSSIPAIDQQLAIPRRNSLQPSEASAREPAITMNRQPNLLPSPVVSKPETVLNYADTLPRDYDRIQQVINDPRSIQSKNQQILSSSSSNLNRARPRKKKRNNHQQRTKQARQKFLSPLETLPLGPIEQGSTIANGKETNDLVSTVNPLEDLLTLIDRPTISSDATAQRFTRDTNSQDIHARLERSNPVDESSLLFSNSFPDDNSTNLVPNLDPRYLWPEISRTHSFSVEDLIHSRPLGQANLRLIDECNSPQCNKDCPALDLDVNIGELT